MYSNNNIINIDEMLLLLKRGDADIGRSKESNQGISSRNDALLILSDNSKNILEEVKKKPWKPNMKRRNRIPDKPHHPLHIWSIMKNCIGKDLSKIPMPVSCFI